MSNKPTKDIKWNYYNFSLIQKNAGNEEKAHKQMRHSKMVNLSLNI